VPNVVPAAVVMPVRRTPCLEDSQRVSGLPSPSTSIVGRLTAPAGTPPLAQPAPTAEAEADAEAAADGDVLASGVAEAPTPEGLGVSPGSAAVFDVPPPPPEQAGQGRQRQVAPHAFGAW
jgi:hypothetical protein